MSNISILPGSYHDSIPADMEKILLEQKSILQKRNTLTPLARNERICRVTMPKQAETREKHLQRLVEDIGKGKKRPCCWPGCPHRRESAKKWFKNLDT